MPAIVYPCQCGFSGEPALGAIQGTVNLVLILVSPSALIISRGDAQNQDSPTLADFVLQNDDHLYNQKSGLAGLIDRAEVRLINHTSSLEKLRDSLKVLDLANDQRLRPSWDQYFMQLASLAARRSNCMKRRVGCVIVREKRVISTGYNGTPRNLKNCNEGGCKLHSLRTYIKSAF